MINITVTNRDKANISIHGLTNEFLEKLEKLLTENAENLKDEITTVRLRDLGGFKVLDIAFNETTLSLFS
jgi:hypothetical protein